MIHFIKQAWEQDNYYIPHTYIYSTDCDIGPPFGYTRVRFVHDEGAVDENGKMYKIHNFTRHTKPKDVIIEMQPSYDEQVDLFLIEGKNKKHIGTFLDEQAAQREIQRRSN